LRQILGDADTRAQFLKNGLDPTPASADEFSKLLRSEIGKWEKVVKVAGIKPE
jgi:tripartite-type tricarboxylate transporter receptor subunit TctC